MEPSSRGSRPACRRRDAGRRSRNSAPHRRRDPFADRLPRWLDGFEGLDVEGRVGWRRKVDDALPKSVEAEEELDFAGADDGAGALHGGLAAGTLERVGTPDAEDEIAPERAHGAGGDLGRRRDDGAAVVDFVCGEEVVPSVMDELPEGQGARAARVMDRGHEGPWEHAAGQPSPVRRQFLGVFLAPKVSAALWERSPRRDSVSLRRTTTSNAFPLLTLTPSKRSFASLIRSRSAPLTLGTRGKVGAWSRGKKVSPPIRMPARQGC